MYGITARLVLAREHTGSPAIISMVMDPLCEMHHGSTTQTIGDTSMSNNQNQPSAQSILDAIRNKPDPKASMHSKLRKMLNNSANGSVQVSTPIGNVTIKEREIDPSEDTRNLENPKTVREALEIAFQKYEETNDDGPEIHEAIVSGEPITVSNKNKDLANKCLLYWGHYLFEKKLENPESLSSWENEIAKLVSTPDRNIMRKWTSLATTLPRFYSINITKLKLMELKESTPEGMSIEFDTTYKIGDKEIPLVSKLKFIESFVQRNSKKDIKTYVFSANYENSYLVQYCIDRNDPDKVRMMDFILANNEKNGVFECRLLAQSSRWAHNFNCLNVQQIEFI